MLTANILNFLDRVLRFSGRGTERSCEQRQTASVHERAGMWWDVTPFDDAGADTLAVGMEAGSVVVAFLEDDQRGGLVSISHMARDTNTVARLTIRMTQSTQARSSR